MPNDEVQGYHLDGEPFCIDCWQGRTGVDSPAMFGEGDTPEQCSQCHRPLDTTLTSEGVEYVIEHLVEILTTKTDEEWLAVHEVYQGTWYQGKPWCSIANDWAAKIADYGLSTLQRRILEMFIVCYTELTGNE